MCKLQKKGIDCLLTHTVSTWILSIAFCTQLVALVTCSANSPPDRTGSTCAGCEIAPRARASRMATVRMLTMFSTNITD